MGKCAGIIIQFVLVLVAYIVSVPVDGASPAQIATTLGDLETRLLEFPTTATRNATDHGGGNVEWRDDTGVGRYVEQRMKTMADSQQNNTSTTKQNFHSPPRTNYILTFRGENYGTRNDVIYVLGTHYRTASGDVTLSGEGSGVIALLEVTQTLINLRRDGCRFNATLVVVAFDFSADGKTYGSAVETGSRVFVERHLPRLLTGGATFGGAYILGSLLNYNPVPYAQTMPKGFSLLPVPLVRELHQHEFRGDFILALSRHLTLLSQIKNQWNTTATWDSCQLTADRTRLPRTWPLSAVPGLGVAFSLHLMSQLFGGTKGPLLPMLTQALQEYPWLLYGDHIPFWYHLPQVPTAFLTDTANLRKGACYAESCTPEEVLTDANLRFYLRTIRAITDTLVGELAEGQKCVADDVRRSVMCKASHIANHSLFLVLFVAILTVAAPDVHMTLNFRT